MRTMVYFSFGILVHLIAWGGTWWGLWSVALLIFWPFYVMWWMGIGIVVIAVIACVWAAVADYMSNK